MFDAIHKLVFLVIYKLLDLKFEILRSSLLRHESFFSIDNERRWIFSSVIVFIYSNMFKFSFPIVSNYTHFVKQSCRFAKKKKKKFQRKKIILQKFLRCLQKTRLGKEECIEFETMVFLLFEGQRT